MDQKRQEVVENFKEQLEKHDVIEEQVKKLRIENKKKKSIAENLENSINSLYATGYLIAEVIKVLAEQKCIIKTYLGPRYIVGWRSTITNDELKTGKRVALDMMTLTIMKILNREIEPSIHKMIASPQKDLDFTQVGGLAKQVRDIREVIELPLQHPELFKRVGITPPKGVLLYGPPGTGKTLLAKAVASSMSIKFIRLSASGVIDKYIGESARLIREIFAYARDHQPCIIFIDEIDAIGCKRGNDGTSADREIQRTLIELLSQIDGFDPLGMVKIIMATNRPDILDPALLRPGRLDRKIEIKLPNEQGRLDILRIHSKKLKLSNDVDLDSVVKVTDEFNGADLRNVCTEAGLLALRDERDSIQHLDFMKAARKIKESKKLESKLEYAKI